MCYVVQNSLLWKGGKKHSQNTAPFPPPRQKKNKKVLDHTERGKPNDIAHRPIIQVFTVGVMGGDELSLLWLGVFLLGVFDIIPGFVVDYCN